MSRDPHSADGAPVGVDVTAGSHLDPRPDEALQAAIFSALPEGEGDEGQPLGLLTYEELGQRKARDFFEVDLSPREARKRQRRRWRREGQRFSYLAETAAAEERDWKQQRRTTCPPTTYPATLPALPGRRSTPALLSRFKRPRTAARPRTGHAPRRVSSSRGDPDPGDGEPPPVKQGRGEAVADSLRVLRAAGPTTASFAEQYGHWPPHEQESALDLLPWELEVEFWGDLARTAAARRGALR